VSAFTDREAQRDARLEAAPAVALVVAFEVGIAVLSNRRGWELWVLPWWTWLGLAAPMLALAAALQFSAIREGKAHRRLALLLLAFVIAANGLALVAVVGSLLTQAPSGPELLVKALALWFTNAITFGLWFWELDGGGPLRRAAGREHIEFQFPQDENPTLATPGWHPRLVDYVYISLTNSIAFSPTDAMPLSRRMKLLMTLEAVVSLTAIVLVAARAVNTLS
jgi:uncharacterized membrane protein